MTTSIQKWGNSLAVRLPREVLRKRSLREGSSVSVTLEDGHIVIREVRMPTPRVRLGDLLSRISAKNVHQEALWGGARGKEIW